MPKKKVKTIDVVVCECEDCRDCADPIWMILFDGDDDSYTHSSFWFDDVIEDAVRLADEHGATVRVEGRDNQTTLRVVCAAVRCDGIIVCGPRHMDGTMRETMAAIDDGGPGHDWSRGEQGFVDQRGVFMTREEALEVARAARQIVRRVGGDEKRLYSENLY